MRISLAPLRERPLAATLVAGSILFVCLLWVGTWFQVAAERERAIEAAITANRNRVIAFEQFVTRTLETADVAGLHLADLVREPLPPASGQVPERIDDPVTAGAMFAAVVITDERGDVRYTTVPEAGPLNLAARPTFSLLRAKPMDRPFISAPRFSALLGKPLIAVTRGVWRRDGTFAGTVSVQLPVAMLTDFNEGAAIRPLDLISVIRLDGITLARREGMRVSYGENLAGRLVIQRQYAEPDGTYLGPSSLDGIRRYFSHRRLKRYPVFVTVGIGEADVLAEVRARTRWYWVGTAALTLAILGFGFSTAHGILRRERAVREIEGANARLRQAQRVGKIGDWEYDVAARTMRWSEQLCRMHGREPQEGVLSLRESLSYLERRHAAGLRRALRLAIETRRPQSYELVVRQKDGSASHRRVLISPVVGPDATVAKVVGIEQDVSVEKAHQQLRDEVAHMARVESMNTMAETIAHELAQPLAAASNFLAAARLRAKRDGAGDAEQVAADIEQVEGQIALTRAIISRARDLVANRLEVGASASVAAIVEDALMLVKIANDCSRIDFRVAIDADAAQVAADKVQIQQVVMNLLRNACEAAGSGAEPCVEVTATRTDFDTVTICVRDNGPGIPKEVGDIFSPFASSKRAGLGLGLSISRAILQSYGGRIWAEHGAAEGAAICFALPAVKAQAA